MPEPAKLHPKNHGFRWRPARGPFKIISEAQAHSFNQRGFFRLDSAIGRETIARITAAIDPLEAEVEQWLRKQPRGRMFIAQADGITFTTHLVKRSQTLREFAASHLFADLCHDLIGPEARLYWDQSVYKKGEYPKPFPWHQDNGYTYIEPQAYLTCWLALTDATLENGCPWIAAGAHRRGTLAHRLTDLGYVCFEQDGPEAVAVPAKAGDIVVFSSLTPHRTGPNLTKSARKTYILQYAPDGARVGGPQGAPCDAADRQFRVLKGGVRVDPPPLSARV
ncbi:MAG TPA: phytanoyl-CoA dioxygenase family protein [Candidatus Binataceae bacterium]